MHTNGPAFSTAPSLSPGRIIAAADRLINEYVSIVGKEYIITNGLHFDHVYEELLYPKFEIRLEEDVDLGVDQQGVKILGRYDVQDNIAYIDSTISRESGDPRRIFTCWHEVAGHGALQGKWLRERLVSGNGAKKAYEETDASIGFDEMQQIERQANIFGACVAAPSWLVNYSIHKIFKPTRKFLYREPSLYWFEVNGLGMSRKINSPAELAGFIGSKISGYFGGLSAEAIGYRLNKLGWIDDRTERNLMIYRTEKSNSIFGNLMAI